MGLAALLIFILWTILDFVIHGLILGNTYEDLIPLIRPTFEMKMGLINLVLIINVGCFVSIYALFVKPKTPKRALGYGALYGLALGFGMGFGTYASMPIPFMLAWVWCGGFWVEGLLAGGILGWLVKENH